MIRLFVPGKLQDGATIALGPEPAHYLRDVMRRSVGDEVVLFNERDGEWRAIVAAIDRRSVSLTPRGRTRTFAAGPDLELIVAVIKRPRLEAVVEKATELGVRRIRLAITRFTQGDRVKLERLEAIAVEAAEQTGRLDVPEIVGPEKLGDILDAWGERTLVFCDEGGDALPMLEALTPLPSQRRRGRLRPRDCGQAPGVLRGPHPTGLRPPPSPAREKERPSSSAPRAASRPRNATACARCRSSSRCRLGPVSCARTPPRSRRLCCGRRSLAIGPLSRAVLAPTLSRN